ncbi:MAG: indolepyruvate ferredoxin oxidoreductase subunit alpha, partial [Thermoprotei archaeon]|nr:indolepyruvate ferredoxin oxidoreductase subunit alpha [Thermoprotei archaeon]
MHKLLLPEGTKVLMLGNEAIARGALEAGVGFASAYPGTPSSEIIESLLEVAKEVGMYVEWSVNEKVAYEAAYAAALSGVRSLVAMKHVGLNVASDPLMTSAYIGVEAGFVVVTADDPNMHSSQNEQDNKWYGLHAYIPVFEPSTPQEAKDLTVFLYGFSEKHKHPVILRSVTRISHTHSVVTLGKMVKPKTKGFFVKNPRERVAVPQYAREMKKKLLVKWRNICNDVVKNPFNRVINSGMENIIIASGIGFSYVYELLKTHNLLDKFTIIKLSSAVPIPRETILRELDNAEKVLIVEEGDPVVEYQVKAIVAEEKMGLEIYGKNVIEPMGELSLSKVAEGVKKAFNIEVGTPAQYVQEDVLKEIPSRPPTLCPGCPYRSLYYALKLTLAKLKVKAVFSGDIGCYTLGVNKPFEMHDTVVDMGASIGLAN